MCGILISTGNLGPFHHRQLDPLRRRGPDGTGFWSDGKLHMAHTRLAIVGVGGQSAEPLEYQRHVLVFNGEIYNYQALRTELGEPGLKSDAEVLLHCLVAWGLRDTLSKLSGFWSFVLYRPDKGMVTLCRDPVGVRPLYYWLGFDGDHKPALAASSMLAPLLEVIDHKPALDYQAMSEYVRYQLTFGDKTFFQTVKKVEPGCFINYSMTSGRMTIRKDEDIWKAGDEPVECSTIGELRTLAEFCVAESTVADRPFTTTCSGGIDSSAVTVLARPDRAFHCYFDDPECNELAHAQAVCDQAEITLTAVPARSGLILSRLENIIEDFDELSVGSVVLPLDDLLGTIRRYDYPVVLTGTGGDELFGGYVRYQLALGECRQPSYQALFDRLASVLVTDPLDRFELCHAKGEGDGYRFYRHQARDNFFGELMSGPSKDPLTRMLTFDRRVFLGGLLNIDDKMAGRHGFEGRPSLLHPAFVRRVVRLSPAALIAGGLKSVGKRVFAPLLPKSVVERTDKMGFTTPIGDMVAKEMPAIKDYLRHCKHSDLFDLEAMDLHVSSKYSREAFGALMLALWLERYA